MNRAVSIILLSTLHASAGPEAYVNFIRQNQQADGVVWDMPVESKGSAASPLMLQRGGALFQLWTVEQSTAKDYLLDQKLVGAYLPVADIRITTLDPYAKIPRTRVDQPFVVDVNLSGLLPVTDFPQASTSVLLERHLGTYSADQASLEPAKVVSSVPFSSAYISANGKTSLRFDASSLTASDPTKASGEEHFVVHALSDGSLTQTQLASGFVQVWPVASGEIKGVKTGDEFRFQAPQVELLLNDLYPRSDTYLMLFEGTQVNGVTGSIVKAYPVDRATSESTVISVTELDSKITKDGTYTLALVSDTVFGRELLCETVTFHVRRTLRVNAMQVGFSDGNDP